jgi:hypothetical protein
MPGQRRLNQRRYLRKWNLSGQEGFDGYLVGPG